MFFQEIADVPRGTMAFMRLITLLLLSLLFSACSKPDPNPELKDPIFNDLSAMHSATKSALEAEKKTLEGFKKDLSEVVPQTGQTKRVQKKVNESENKITRLEQEAKYLELKLSARKKEAKKSYMKAFSSKSPWPDPKEWQDYSAEKRLREAKRTWDVKQRIAEQLGEKDEKAPKAEASGGH